MKTEQERFWAGEFARGYMERNRFDGLLAANRSLFARILDRTRDVRSVLELGANIGLNLRAMHDLRPDLSLTGVELAAEPAAELAKLPFVTAIHDSILEWRPTERYDLVFTKGVLIHIAPNSLPTVYDLMHQASSRYILMAEYYNPTPIAIPYHGHDNKLFKRDFCGDFMDRHPDVELVDYGFVWRRDPNAPQDDITWFLMRKRT